MEGRGMWHIHRFWSLWRMPPLLPRFLCQLVLVPVMLVFTSKSAQISGGRKISGSRDAKLKSRLSRRNLRPYFNPRGWLTLSKENTAMKSVKSAKSVAIQFIEHSHIKSNSNTLTLVSSRYTWTGHHTDCCSLLYPHHWLDWDVFFIYLERCHKVYLMFWTQVLKWPFSLQFYKKGKKETVFSHVIQENIIESTLCLSRKKVNDVASDEGSFFSLVALTYWWTQV